MYIALIKVVPAVIGPYVNLGGDGSVLGESFALYPSILGCSPMQSWLLPIYLPILSCPPSCVPKGCGVLVSRDVAMVGVGRRSCPIGDHLRLFSSLLDTTQMNNAVPTSPLLQQMGHPHSYPSLGQIDPWLWWETATWDRGVPGGIHWPTSISWVKRCIKKSHGGRAPFP